MRAEPTLVYARPAARARTVALARAVPAAIAAVLVLPSVVWDVLDRSVWPWDPAWYGEVSVDLWARLRLDPGGWPTAMAHAFGAKPPAVAWLGQFFVPWGRVFGDQEAALLLSVVACQAVSIVLVYTAARRLRAPSIAALAAALALGAAPLFVSMSHEFFAEPTQTLAVAWLLFILASASRWPLALTLVQLPGVLALAMLAKLSSPAYVAAPTLGVLALAFLRYRRARTPHEWSPTPSVVASAGVSLALVVGAAGWYSVNLHAAIEHARIAGADTGLYGVDQGFGRQLPDWIDRFRDAAFLPHVWLPVLLAAAAALALDLRARRRPTVTGDAVIAAAACLVTLGAVLAVFATQPNNESRYLLPLVPCLALVVALAVARSRAAATAAVAVLAAEFALVTLASFGRTPFDALTYPRIVAPVRDASFANELDRLVNETCTAEANQRISMVGADHPWFNANTLTMLAAERFSQTGRKCYYTSLGYAASDPNVAWKRVLDFKPPFYVSIDYGNRANPLPAEQRASISQNDPFNRVNRVVYRRVLRSSLFAPVGGSRRYGFVVLHARAEP